MHLYETTESIHFYQEEKIPISIKTHIIILFHFLISSEFTSPDGQKFYSKDSLTGFTPENHYPGSSSGSGYRYESPGGTGPRSRSGSGSVSPGKRYNGGSGSVGNEQNIRTENRMNSELDDRTGTGGMDPKKDNRGNGIDGVGNRDSNRDEVDLDRSPAVQQAESLHLACKALLLLVRHRGSHLKVSTSICTV